jgi:hypothetical protein
VTGDAPATVVWIAARPPDAAEARAVAGWAHAHGVAIVAPRDERPTPLAVSPAAADAIEDLLDRARDATAAHDGAAIDSATSAAESLLRAHPELPQAAWLMAEIERARATRWRRVPPDDPEAAEREWQRAEALDDGRVPGIGETSAAAHPAEARLTLAVPGDDQAWLDGRPVSAAVATHAGPHALVVTAEGAPVWAGWIEVGPGSSTLEVDAPATTPCSIADTARADLAGADETLRAGRVRCTRWVAVVPGAPGTAPGTIRVASCEASRCGALVEWRDTADAGDANRWMRQAPGDAANAVGRPARPWPTWATWAIAGAGVAVAAGIVAVVASGALQAAPTETRFVSGGLKNQ